MNESASSASGQEFDVFSVMDWKDGIGTLPGSDLKFRVNEFGALEVITDETEMESVKKATATTTWMVPTAQEEIIFFFHCAAFSEKTGIPLKLKDATKVDGLIFCENCYHDGTTEEFVSEGKFCSQKCAHHIKNKEPKEDKDGVECNEEDDSKGTRKRKTKLPLKDECKEDGEDKKEKDETVSMLHKTGPADSFTLYSKGKKLWCWASYLEEEKATAAPTKLFKEYQSFPYGKNGFKVGMKLEGVDPEHQSMYCILTVAEVMVHFANCYIHPAGWCEKTGHKLHPPKGYEEEEFNWPSYLKTCKAQPAPKSLFENQNTQTVIPSGFRVGMKLEAVDKKNPTFICVATVTDMVDNRFLVHFDNWDESYDYWCEAASPHIHPIGWCKEHRRTLITPPDYPHAKHFSWEKYLEETSSLPAPARAFKVKPSHGFQKNMKLEVVDKRNPVLIRVATVVDIDDHRIKVHFDGWDSIYDYWTDADSPDIHPAGWCAKTGHPLQPPLSPLELVEALEHGGCPTAGCKGVGHIKRARHMGHHRYVDSMDVMKGGRGTEDSSYPTVHSSLFEKYLHDMAELPSSVWVKHSVLAWFREQLLSFFPPLHNVKKKGKKSFLDYFLCTLCVLNAAGRRDATARRAVSAPLSVVDSSADLPTIQENRLNAQTSTATIATASSRLGQNG
uniref:L3MBTL histone methyl-lysine binding protein 3 n=1 Tax=Chelonoidis abingdonii TaxID=106734 RepID=A0A8C0J6B2_CHEAB